MQLDLALRKTAENLPGIIKDILRATPTTLAGYIGAEMEKRGTSAGGASVAFAPSTSKKLQTGTTALFKSLLPNKPGNITKLDGTNLEYGTDIIYAGVQEFGGFIRDKGHMQGFFWWRYKETKSPYYRNLALSVRKKGGVTIPARPYFAPGIEKFKSEGLPKLLAAILKKVEL